MSSTLSASTTTDLWDEAHSQAAARIGEVVRRALRRLREPELDSHICHVEIPCPDHAIYEFQCQWCSLNKRRASAARSVGFAQKTVEEAIGTNKLDDAYHSFLITVQEEMQLEQALQQVILRTWSRMAASGSPDTKLALAADVRLKGKKKLTSDRSQIMEYRFRSPHYRVQKLKGEHRHG